MNPDKTASLFDRNCGQKRNENTKNIMAKSSTIQIAIEVDDRGSVKLKKLGDASRQAGDDGKKSMSGFRRSIVDLDNSSKVTITTLTKLGAIGFATVIGGLAALTAGMFKSLRVSSDLSEVTSKFGVVFGDQLGRAEAWSVELVNSYAMSTREAKQYLSSVQDLLVPMGMVPDAAGKMSFGITTLAADLGSFNNLPTAQVMDDIQSALVGNYETMKKYGVVINASTVEQQALTMGLAATKDELTAADKAQAAYQMMLDASSAAIGDMARTSDGYANQLKQFHALTEDLTAAMGKRLLPIAADVLGKINSGMKDGAGGVDSLATTISVKLLGALGMAVEGIRFFHNGWLGIKLVGTGAIDAIAHSIEYLFGGLRTLLKPLDLAMEGLKKLGAIDANPFDGIEAVLGTFSASSRDVTNQVLADIDKTNAGYDRIKATITSYINDVKNAAVAEKELAEQNTAVSDSIAATAQAQQQATNSIVTNLQYTKAELATFAREGKKLGEDMWLTHAKLSDEARMRSIQNLADMQEQTANTGQFMTSTWENVTSAFIRGEDAKVVIARTATDMLIKFSTSAAEDGLPETLKALGAQIGAWVGLGTAESSTGGSTWKEKIASGAAYLASVGVSIFAGKALGEAFHASGGWLGANPQGGLINQGSGVRDDVFLGYTDGGLTRNWGMGGEYVINKDSTRVFFPLLEAINNKKFADGGAVTDPWGPTRSINDSGFDTFWDTLLESKFNWYKAAATAVAYYAGTAAGMLGGKALGKNLFAGGGLITDRPFGFGGFLGGLLNPVSKLKEKLPDPLKPFTEPSTAFGLDWYAINYYREKHPGSILDSLDFSSGSIPFEKLWALLRKMPIVGESVEHADNILYPFVRDVLTPGRNASFATLGDMLKGVFAGIEKEGKALLSGGLLSTKWRGIFHAGTDYVPETGSYLLKEGEKVIPVGGYSGDNSAEEIREMRRELMEINMTIADHTFRISRVLEKFDAVGIRLESTQ